MKNGINSINILYLGSYKWIPNRHYIRNASILHHISSIRNFTTIRKSSLLVSTWVTETRRILCHVWNESKDWKCRYKFYFLPFKHDEFLYLQTLNRLRYVYIYMSVFIFPFAIFKWFNPGIVKLYDYSFSLKKYWNLSNGLQADIMNKAVIL